MISSIRDRLVISLSERLTASDTTSRSSQTGYDETDSSVLRLRERWGRISPSNDHVEPG
jgi:hypothetical protein